MTWSPLSCVRSSARRRSAVHSARGPAAPVFVLQVAQPGAQVGGKRRQFRGGQQGAEQALAAHDGARPIDPAAPAELGHHHRDHRDHQSQRRDQADQVAPRVLAAAVDEAQVVQQHQSPEQHRRRLNLLCRWLCFKGDESFVGQHAGRWIDGTRGRGALPHHIVHTHQHLARRSATGSARHGGTAPEPPHRTNWMGIGRSSAATCPRGCTDQWRKAARPARCGRTETAAAPPCPTAMPRPGNPKARWPPGAAAVQVAAEPAQRDLVHQGCSQVRGRDQRCNQRQQEPHLKADRLQIHGRRDTPRS
jgi:hypothetical protein